MGPPIQWGPLFFNFITRKSHKIRGTLKMRGWNLKLKSCENLNIINYARNGEISRFIIVAKMLTLSGNDAFLLARVYKF